MMRPIQVGLAVLGTTGLLALGVVLAVPAAAATNGVSIVYDSGSATCDPVYAGSPCFGPPNTGLNQGDTTVLTLGVQQTATENPDMTVDLSWDGAMTFVSAGDTSAVCTPVSATEESCFYTDAAHGYKYDSYTFTVGANTPGQVVTTTINVATESAPATNDGGTDSGTATITMTAPVPTPSPTPTATVPVPTTGSGTGLLIGTILALVGLAMLGGSRLIRRTT